MGWGSGAVADPAKERGLERLSSSNGRVCELDEGAESV